MFCRGGLLRADFACAVHVRELMVRKCAGVWALKYAHLVVRCSVDGVAVYNGPETVKKGTPVSVSVYADNTTVVLSESGCVRMVRCMHVSNKRGRVCRV